MDISEIIEDSFKYPVDDFKKFLILGIPNLVIAIFAALFVLQGVGLSSLGDVSEKTLMSSPLFSTFIVTFLLFILVAIICSIMMSGIGLSVIRQTIQPSDVMPDIQPVKNFIDGIKSFIVSFIYVIVPVLVYVIVVSSVGSLLGDNGAFLVFIVFILFLIAMVFIGIILTVALSRLAETNSISKALDVTGVYETAKQIGLLKIFGVIVICNVLLGVLSLVGVFISIIPILGTIIVMYLLYTYAQLVTYRAYGLLYRERNPTQAQNAFQEPYTPIGNAQNQQISNESQDFKPDENNTEGMDFERVNQNDNSDDNTEAPLKKCTNCGYSNPDYVSICVNCGKEL